MDTACECVLFGAAVRCPVMRLRGSWEYDWNQFLLVSWRLAAGVSNFRSFLVP